MTPTSLKRRAGCGRPHIPMSRCLDTHLVSVTGKRYILGPLNLGSTNLVLPKKSLTGDSTERVDTRVLQVIYRIEENSFPLFVGQQMDVFIDAGNDPMK